MISKQGDLMADPALSRVLEHSPPKVSLSLNCSAFL